MNYRCQLRKVGILLLLTLVIGCKESPKPAVASRQSRFAELLQIPVQLSQSIESREKSDAGDAPKNNVELALAAFLREAHDEAKRYVRAELKERTSDHLNRTNLAVLLLIYGDDLNASIIASESLSRNPEDVRAMIVLATVSQSTLVPTYLESRGCLAREHLLVHYQDAARQFEITECVPSQE